PPLERCSDALDALFDYLGRTVGEIQPDEMVVSFVYKERASRHERHMFSKGVFEQVFTSDRFRQLDPQKQAAFGMSPPRLYREIAFESVEHSVASIPVDLA